MSSSPERILVAEGDEVVLALISHILRRQGYWVDAALSAEQARQCLSEGSYAAIVIDSKLIDVVDRDGWMPRTILLSPREISDFPVHTVIQKPVEFGLLVDTVRKIIG